MPSLSGPSSFRFRWLAVVVLINTIAPGLLGAKTPATCEALVRSSSFAEWRDGHRGWNNVGNVTLNPAEPTEFDETRGKGVVVSQGDAPNLESLGEYQDVDVRLEFMIPKHSNTGVKLLGRYEIQILDTHGDEALTGDSCGGIYPRAEQEPSYHHIDRGVPPRVNAARPAGEWQTLEIQFIAPRFDAAGKKISNAKFARVALNGKLIHENVEVSSPTGAAWRLVKEVPRGPLLLQGDHGPAAFRKIRIRPRN